MFASSVPAGILNSPDPSSVAGSLLRSVVTSEADMLIAGVWVVMCVQESDAAVPSFLTRRSSRLCGCAPPGWRESPAVRYHTRSRGDRRDDRRGDHHLEEREAKSVQQPTRRTHSHRLIPAERRCATRAPGIGARRTERFARKYDRASDRRVRVARNQQLPNVREQKLRTGGLSEANRAGHSLSGLLPRCRRCLSWPARFRRSHAAVPQEPSDDRPRFSRADRDRRG